MRDLVLNLFQAQTVPVHVQRPTVSIFFSQQMWIFRTCSHPKLTALPFLLLFEVIITDSRFPCISPKASSLPFSYFHLSLWMRDIKTEFAFKGEDKRPFGHLRLQMECRRTVPGVSCRHRAENDKLKPNAFKLYSPLPCPPFSPSTKYCKITGKSLKNFSFTSILSTVRDFKYLFLAFKTSDARQELQNASQQVHADLPS